MNQYNGSDYLAFAGPLLALYIFICMSAILVGYALNAFLLSGVFAKASIPRWKAWVPVYNNWTFLQLGGQPGWLALLLFVPVALLVPAVFLCIAAFHIGRQFGKDGIWVLLYIFVPVVWFAIIAFDKSRYSDTPVTASY